MSENTEAPVTETPDGAVESPAPSPGAQVVQYAPRAHSGMPAKVQYAKLLADSGLLPAAYRRNPANVLYAIEYGDMLGLSPMAAITGVHIIEGKPSASAGLISALVRRAGHKLRVRGDARSATCQIIRSDDPDYVFEVTWTLRKGADGNPSAEEAGLLNKGTWKQYASAMLKSRAITQCARDACEEALFGLHYTPEELGANVDGDGNVIAGELVPDDAPDPGREWFDAMLAKAQAFADEAAGNVLWAEVVERKNNHMVTVAAAEQLKNAIRARWQELAAQQKPGDGQDGSDEAVQGELVTDLDTGDPWALRVEEIASADDAEAVASEVDDAVSSGELSEGKANAVRAAIAGRAAQFEQAAAA